MKRIVILKGTCLILSLLLCGVLYAAQTEPPQPAAEEEHRGQDLELLSGTLEFTAPAFRTGQEIKIAVKIKNIGTKKITPVEVAFYADGEKIGEDSASGMNSGEKKRFTVYWTPVLPGRYTIYAIADPNKLIDEIDEGNNRDERTITIEE